MSFRDCRFGGETKFERGQGMGMSQVVSKMKDAPVSFFQCARGFWPVLTRLKNDHFWLKHCQQICAVVAFSPIFVGSIVPN